MDCRRFLKLGRDLVGAYVDARHHEPYWLQVHEQPVALVGLPPGLDGLRIVQLSDLHLGPWVPLDYLQRALALANSLRPELIVLTGDYVRRSRRNISPICAALAQLEAPLGVYSVFGNHDWWEDKNLVFSREQVARAGIVDLTNRGVSIGRGGGELWLAGVADLWTGHPDLGQALVGAPAGQPVVLLSHNPSFIAQVHDPRVKLMLSGHTHGGQVNLPLLGPLVVSLRHGNKYAAGLVPAGATQVYVTRGVGMAVLPFRFRCRPEVTVLTLRASEPPL